MRDIDDIDRDLRVLSLIRNELRELGGVGTTTLADQLLDERLAAAAA